MNVLPEECSLTAEESALAAHHWQALMFNYSRIELEAAQLELLKAPLCVQHAVIADINDLWLREYQPLKSQNPFLTVPFSSLPTSSSPDTQEQAGRTALVAQTSPTPATAAHPNMTFLEGLFSFITQWAQSFLYSPDLGRETSLTSH